jgi:hypothetical protein
MLAFIVKEIETWELLRLTADGPALRLTADEFWMTPDP